MKRIISLFLARALILSASTIFAGGGPETGKPAGEKAKAAETVRDQPGGVQIYSMEQVEKEKQALFNQKAPKKFKIAHLWCIASVPYAATAIPTTKGVIEQAGHTHIIFDANLDAAVQANQVENAIAMGVDGIIIFPVDSKAIIPALKKAYDAKIPVLLSYAKVDEENRQYTIGYAGPDDYSAGVVSADLMAEALKGQGNAAIIEGAAGQEHVVLRSQGFKDRLAAIAPTIKIIATQNTNWSKESATSAMEDFLIRYPNLNGVFTHDDFLGAGAGIALKEAGKTTKDVVIIGFGGSKDGLAAVKDGLIYGTHVQSPVLSGTLEAVKMLQYLYAKKKLPEQLKPYWNYQPLPKVTPENVDSFLPGEW